MKIRFYRFILLLLLFIISVNRLIFGNQPKSDPDAACASCGACSAFTVVLIIIFIALNIALLIWVARDSKSRGMDSSVLWMVLVMFTGPIGLLIYIFSRPQGNLIKCIHCQNNRLQASAKCPHCNNI